MSTDWANSEQRAWMSHLATIPPQDRCASGWHILPGSLSALNNSAEKCDCARIYGYASLGLRQAALAAPEVKP